MLMPLPKIGILFKVTKCRPFYLLTWFSICLLFSTLVLSSFVVCDHRDGAAFASSSQESNVSSVNFEKANFNTSVPVDDCSPGACHFGHCPNLVLPLVSGVNFSNLFQIQYHLKSERPPNRFLDVPYQPPKLS